MNKVKALFFFMMAFLILDAALLGTIIIKRKISIEQEARLEIEQNKVTEKRFAESWPINDYIFCYEKDGKRGICDGERNIKAPAQFDSITDDGDGYVWASTADELDYSYTAFDVYGNPLSGVGSALPDVTGIQWYWGDSMFYARFTGEGKVNKYGISESTWYEYLNNDLSVVTNAGYHSVCPFGTLYFAVATYSVDDNGGTKSVVVNKDGSEYCELPDFISPYNACNGYFASVSDEDPTMPFKGSLVNLETNEVMEYDSIEFVPRSTCIIVQDSAGYYGVYNGYEMAFDCEYDSIDIWEGDSGSTGAELELHYGDEEPILYFTPYVYEKPEAVTGYITSASYDTYDEAEDDAEYILPFSDSRYLSESDLEGLSSEELELARNEIFARHGRIFTTEYIRDYFLSKSWYEELYDPEYFDTNVKSIFNDYELNNVEFISDYESQY